MDIAEQRLQHDKDLGLQAYKSGDYQTALNKLAEYINHEEKRDPTKIDPQALLAFSVSRAQIPSANEDYLIEAIKTLQWYCSLVPTDADAKERLIELELPHATYAPDVLARSNDALQSNPDDLAALKAIAILNYRQRDFRDAAPASQHYVSLAPTDLEMQWLNFQVMAQLNDPPSAMQQQADALIAKYPTDPRFKIVKAYVYRANRNRLTPVLQTQADFDQYHALVLAAAKADPPSPQFVNTAIGLLDEMGEFGAAEDLLNRAAPKFGDPALSRQLIERLWAFRQFTEIVDRLKNLDPNSTAVDANLVAYKALSLYELGKTADAAALVEILDGRDPADTEAHAWAIALKARYGNTQEDLKTRVADYKNAESQAPDNGYVAFLLGQAYAQMGENDLALEAFRQACRWMPSWSEPHSQLALMLVRLGRGTSDEAVSASQDARMAGTDSAGRTDLQAAIANIRVSYARLLASPNQADAASLLGAVKQIQTQLPNEPETLPMYVALLAQTGQRDDAINAIKAACASPGDDGQDLLSDLAETSRAAHLGMEDTIYAAISQKYGQTPRLAYSRAMGLLEAGHPDDGLKLLLDAKPKTQTADAAYWDRAICQYRENAHDPSAADEWEKLGNAYPNDIEVQSTILSAATSAWNDKHDFMRQTIDRVKALTGSDANAWRTADARWMLTGPDAAANAPEAVKLLTSVTDADADQYLPHVLLAMAYDDVDNHAAGLDEWRKAAAIEPQSPEAQFSLLQALHNLGKKEETDVVFQKLSALPNIPPDLALAAATIVAAEGDMPHAEAMLLAYPKCSNQVLHDATLAKVYRVENRPNDAAQVYFGLASAKGLDANTIHEAADFFGSQGQKDEAQKFLDRLSDPGIPVWQSRLVQAEYEEEHGSPSSAAALYDQAVQAAGNNPDLAIQQIGFLIRQHDWIRAEHAISDASTRWPSNTSITNLGKAESALAAYPHLDEVSTLIEALTADPNNTAANDVIAVATNPTTTAAQVRAMLDKYPGFEPLYELASRRLMNAGDRAQAVTIASQAMTRFPHSVDAARTTAEVNAAGGNWNDALIAAHEWRQRLTDNPQPADEFTAIADLAVGQPQDAADCLSPYIAQASAHPDDNQSLLTTYCQALIRAGRQSDAQALLLPLAKNEVQWRLAWLNLAPVSFADGQSSAQWIEIVKPLLTPDSVEEQEALAEAYVACADRMGYSADYTLARDVLKPFIGTSKMGARQWLTYAGAASGADDNSGAAQAYREVLKLDPDNAIAENNLADLLRQAGGPNSLNEAEGLIEHAIANHATETDAYNFYDTQARILMKQGRNDDAIAAFEKGYAINPTSLDILIGLATVYAGTNRTGEASHYLSQVDDLMASGPQLSPELKAELDATRKTVLNANMHNTVSGTDYTPGGK
jgi:Tfp pilus assembly protein PilF